MEKTTQAAASGKAAPLGRKIWACAIVFGLIGQIAWVVENMFFAKFGQDLFDTRGELYFTVTTLMVILSAVIVRSKDAGTRARLLAERDAAQNRQTADTEDENVQTAE